MTYPTAASYPQYEGTFIPEIWAGALTEKFYTSTVFAEISNTKYEGEISGHGSKVIIRARPDIEIYDYVKGQDLSVQVPTGTVVELNIDKGKYFNFKCDDIDAHQSDVKIMSEFTDDATSQMKIKIDLGILADVYASAHADNSGATAGRISNNINLGVVNTALQVTASTVLGFLVDMGTVLDEQDIPEDDRFVVLPAWVCGMVKKSDLKDASLAGDGTSILRNGRIGMIDRFTIYRSNQVDTTIDSGPVTTWEVIAGHKSALTFASQMTNMETLRSEKTFGNLVRGLNVYGYKVEIPKALVAAHIKQ